MKTYHGGQSVEPGYYLNRSSFAVETINEQPLPGDAASNFYRVPLPALLLLGPVVALLFVAFLPFIGFAMAGYAVARAVAPRARAIAHEIAWGFGRMLRPAWQPTMAFFGRRKQARRKRTGKDAWAEDMGRKLEQEPKDDDR